MKCYCCVGVHTIMRHPPHAEISNYLAFTVRKVESTTKLYNTDAIGVKHLLRALLWLSTQTCAVVRLTNNGVFKSHDPWGWPDGLTSMPIRSLSSRAVTADSPVLSCLYTT